MTVFPTRKTVTAESLVAEFDTEARVLGCPARKILALGPLTELCEGVMAFCNAGPGTIAARLGDADGATVIIDLRSAEAALELSAKVTLIAVPDPRRYFIRAFVELVSEEVIRQDGIAETAIVHSDAKLGVGTSVGPGAFVAKDVVTGANTAILGGAQIYEGTRIGRNCVIQANCTIGGLGQSYERDDEGSFIFMPHMSNVILGDEVVVGSNTTIVRGTLQDTVIGPRTIIGNNSVIGHNVEIGEGCHLGAGIIVCGSSRVADGCWLSVGSVVQSVPLGEGVMVGIGAIVTREVKAGTQVNGFPARVTSKFNKYNETSGR